MNAKYDPKKIEPKWQKYWETKKLFHGKTGSKKKKFYALVEFPYPSGEGLHTGHVRGYTAMDIVARKRRMEGFETLYPIGWDAFGLPTENFAIKTGIHPEKVTKKNTDTFRTQMKSLGFSFDWSREINTTNPEYYKWTQWIFLQLFKKGLAYKAKMNINWCPSCKIGLANEEAIGGVCERCGKETETREKEQWMLAITKYADRLDKDLDGVDYVEKIKVGQRNWIGRSEGTTMKFRIKEQGAMSNEHGTGSRERELFVEVFTTRVDTIFGCTYVVVAPEHPFISELLDRHSREGGNPDSADVLDPRVKPKDDGSFEVANAEEVREYIESVKKKTEQERNDATKEKTGVKLEGIEAVNPFTGEAVPVFVADYVLGNYGTGAVMAVPAHDERDFVFAKKYELPIRQSIAPYVVVVGDGAPRSDKNVVQFNSETAIIKHWEKDLYYVVQFKTGQRGFVGGSVEDGENLSEATQREIVEESGYSDMEIEQCLFEHAYSRGYKTRKSREELCHEAVFVVRLRNSKRIEIVDHAIKDGAWLNKEEVLRSNLISHHRYYFEYFLKNLDAYVDDGVLVHSGEFTGLKSEEAREKMTAWLTKRKLGKRQVNYRLRDWVFSRQRYWGEPIPLVFCPTCAKATAGEGNSGWVPIPEKDLPLKLPKVVSYTPTDTGESPLATMEKWVKTKCPHCGGPARRETDTMPNWAGSSWYYLAYVMQGISNSHPPAGGPISKYRKTFEYWTPVDWYNGGMEHTTLHLLYSRFWHKFLYDIGVVPTKEPYQKRTSHGLILAEGGVKMSKSKGNVVNPDDIVRRFGADTLRVYEMFMGPFDQDVAWSTESISGSRRFLEKAWRLQERITNEAVQSTNEKFLTLLHKTIKKVSEDIEGMRFNTAISALMILANEMERSEFVAREDFETFLILLSPFAPHIAEELWQLRGNKQSIMLERWPKANPKFLREETTEVIVQVNGKLRARLRVSVGASQDEVERHAREEDVIKKYIDNSVIRKVIFVPDRLVNFVV